MKIAVASDGLDVSLHGGRCTSYMCYTVERGIITECQNTPNSGLSPLRTADFLKKLGVDVFMTYRVEPRFAAAVEAAGIESVTGASGSARQAVEDYIAHMFIGDDNLDDEEFGLLEA